MSGEKLNAIISGRAGLALLVQDNTLESIHIDALDTTVPRRLEEYHLLFGENDDLEFLENVETDEVRRRLTIAVDREEALDLTLILLDSELSSEVRSDAAQELENLLQNDNIVEQLERIFFAKQLPESADHQGGLEYLKAAASNVAVTFLQRLIDRQPRIRDVRQAWDAIPESKFGSGAERDVVEAHFVRDGVFRDLVCVRDAAESIDNFLQSGLQKAAATELDSHKADEILQEWIAISQHHTRKIPSKLIFISHDTADDDFVKELRLALEEQGLKLWVDSRDLVAGQRLHPEIERAIEGARQVIVVLSKNTVNSAWVHKEVQKAQEVEGQRKEQGYRVIPLLLEGMKPTALGTWFDEEPLAVPIELKPGGLSEALPQILAALGERLPDDRQPLQDVESSPVEELILKLIDPRLKIDDGKRQISATATLIYDPATNATPEVESTRYIFTAPLGPIEAEDLRWYLERYYIWPTGVFAERAERIKNQLPQWGQRLYHKALGTPAAQSSLNAWQNATGGRERRFSVWVDADLPEETDSQQQTEAKEAATLLLSLPWELVHDGRSYLFRGNNPVRVRRRLPNRYQLDIVETNLPIRILLASPRPENQHTGYIDHRISARPLIEAIEKLGELVELSVLTPPTFPALQQALKQARDDRKPFDVVHFDGHGVYDPKYGLGGLCFEDPQDLSKLTERGMTFITAQEMAEVMRDCRIPVVFLEACQSAQAEEDPTASVAAKLLEEGVTSVVAMTHSVLVETARRFVEAFYKELAQGARVGTAMLAGQNALINDTYRGKVMGAGDLHLQDWFVPVLYQEEQDPQLLTVLPSKQVQQIQTQQRELRLGALPAAPPHQFIGRSRELLAMERLLLNPGVNYAVVIGTDGSGKTALAVELARWLVRTGRFRRTAFVSLETVTDPRAVLDSLGRQLLPDGENWSVAQFPNLKGALQPVERGLRDMPTVIVLDNLESVLPDLSGQSPPGVAPIDELFGLCQSLLAADPKTRLVFTSREPLPEPFNHGGCGVRIGALSEKDAVELVSSVMANEGLEPNTADPGRTGAEVEELVEAVNRHARALVLLAREVARQGVRTTTENLRQLMAYLHEKYPDDRENSLYASLELSLRRLPDEVRERIGALGLFHGGANSFVLGRMLEMPPDALASFVGPLIEVGLAEPVHRFHLRLDPALPSYLLGGMDDDERTELLTRWAEAMTQLVGFLSQQQGQDAQLAAELMLLELPNLLAWLRWMGERETPERVIGLADSVERLFSVLGRPQALAEATRIREAAAAKLGESNEWSHGAPRKR